MHSFPYSHYNSNHLDLVQSYQSASKRAAKDSCMSDANGSCWRSWAPQTEIWYDMTKWLNLTEIWWKWGRKVFLVLRLGLNQHLPLCLFLGSNVYWIYCFNVAQENNSSSLIIPAGLGSIKEYPLYLTKFIKTSYKHFQYHKSVKVCKNYVKVVKFVECSISQISKITNSTKNLKWHLPKHCLWM